MTISLPKVTLIAVSGIGHKSDENIVALKKSCEGIEFGEVKYIQLGEIKDIDTWNRAVIYELPKYVETSHALFVHGDGHVINSTLWKPEWLELDYVGAPWPLPVDGYSYRSESGKLQRVGNSVSLRSKKLMDLVAHRPWKPYYGNTNEDGFICCHNREWLEEQGCKFGTLEQALDFGREYNLPEHNMIYGLLHQGSGLGNMLHRYVATRVLALDKSIPFSIIQGCKFKGENFMDLDFGGPSDISFYVEYPMGKTVPIGKKVWEEKTNYYNPEFNFIEDNTIIDGEFQSEQYFGHRMKEINEWLKVEPIDMPDDVCVIGFRGGEFYVFPELGLPKEYFEEGIARMKEINPNMKFEVHTDDVLLAAKFFPEYNIIHDIGINWRSMRYAKYAIIANSSFYILPRLLSEGFTIAPQYWARRNTKEWSMPQNYYKSFKYI